LGEKKCSYCTSHKRRWPTYEVDHLAGAEAVVEARPALVLWVLPPGQDVLVAQVVGPFVHHPGPALHPDGVAAAQVGVEVRAVAVALIATSLEVLVLVEDNLGEEGSTHGSLNSRRKVRYYHL